MASFEEWKKRRQRPQATITLAAAPGLSVRLETVDDKIAALKAKSDSEGMLDRPEGLDELEAEAAGIRDEIAESGTTFVFESMGARQWRDLVAKYPPTDEQRKSPRSFPYNHDDADLQTEVIRRSLADPHMNDDDFREFVDSLSQGEFNALWSVAHGVNVGGGGTPEALTATAPQTHSPRRRT